MGVKKTPVVSKAKKSTTTKKSKIVPKTTSKVPNKKEVKQAEKSKLTFYSVTTTCPDYQNGGQRVTIRLFKEEKAALAMKETFVSAWDADNEDVGTRDFRKSYSYYKTLNDGDNISVEIERGDMNTSTGSDGEFFYTRMSI